MRDLQDRYERRIGRLRGRIELIEAQHFNGEGERATQSTGMTDADLAAAGRA
jgi:hypothetical protein